MYRIVIKEIRIKGFAHHKEECRYSFNNFSLILGENGKGKTTIANAISWCLTNANYNGKEKVTKELLNKYSKVAEVSITVEINIDDNICIKEFKRISGGGQEIDGFFINGEKAPSQSFLNQLNIDKNLFFSMINPLYFSSLSKSEAKDTILKVVKKIKDEEVLSNLDEYQKELLINNGFKNDINSFIIQIKDNIKHYKEDNIYFQGMIDAKKEKIEIPTLNIEDLNKTSQNLLKEIADMDITIKKEYVKEFKNQKLIEENIEKTNDLKQQLAVLTAQSKGKEIERLQSEINYYKNYPLPPAPQMQNICILQQQVKELRNKYKQLNMQIKQIRDMKISCNRCGNEIILPNPQKNMIFNQLNEVKQNGFTASHNLEQIGKQNTDLQNKYQVELKNIKEKIQYEIKQREEHVIALSSQQESPDVIRLKKEIEKLENEKQDLQLALQEEKKYRNEDISKLDNKLKEKLREKDKIDSERINYNNLLTLDKKRKEELEKTEKMLAANEQDLVNAKNVLDITKIFIGLKVKMQQIEFKKYLSNVQISLDKVVKSTGELKEDFSIFYEGKEFNQLSNSEKIKAGLELINMFTKLKQIYLPVIIDNAESITKYNSVKNCQTIEMRVEKDMNITVA